MGEEGEETEERRQREIVRRGRGERKTEGAERTVRERAA